MGETMRLLKERNREPGQVDFTPEHLADLIRAAEEGKVNDRTAKAIFEKIFDEDVEPLAYMEEHNLTAVNDDSLLAEAAEKLIIANPNSVEEYLNGKDKVMGFFVGRLMKEMKGKANPQSAQKIIREKLEARKNR